MTRAVTTAVILAGGLGTRLMEETDRIPKPMVEIGGRPILWHIMKMYEAHGIKQFIICLGYKGYIIKEFFANYYLHQTDVTFSIKDNVSTMHEGTPEPWTVTLIDTGETTMTGGRLRRIRDRLGDRPFCATYGDAVSTVDISSAIDFHLAHGKLATVTAVRPPARFGALKLEGDRVEGWVEKPIGDGQWINGGFFVFSPAALDYIDGDHVALEEQQLERLTRDGELMAWRHEGFWHPMDTLREKRQLEALWASGSPPWVNPAG